MFEPEFGLGEGCPDDIDDGPEAPGMMYVPLCPNRRHMIIPDCKVRSKRARVEESNVIELVIMPVLGDSFQAFSIFCRLSQTLKVIARSIKQRFRKYDRELYLNNTEQNRWMPMNQTLGSYITQYGQAPPCSQTKYRMTFQLFWYSHIDTQDVRELQEVFEKHADHNADSNCQEELCVLALEKDAWALKWANNELTWFAVLSCPLVCRMFSPPLMSSYPLNMWGVMHHEELWDKLPTDQQKDNRVILAVLQGGKFPWKAAANLQYSQDRHHEMAFDAVIRRPTVFFDLPFYFQCEEVVIKATLLSRGDLIQQMPEHVKTKKKWILLAIQTAPAILQNPPFNVFLLDEEVMEACRSHLGADEYQTMMGHRRRFLVAQARAAEWHEPIIVN